MNNISCLNWQIESAETLFRGCARCTCTDCDQNLSTSWKIHSAWAGASDQIILVIIIFRYLKQSFYSKPAHAHFTGRPCSSLSSITQLWNRWTFKLSNISLIESFTRAFLLLHFSEAHLATWWPSAPGALSGLRKWSKSHSQKALQGTLWALARPKPPEGKCIPLSNMIFF